MTLPPRCRPAELGRDLGVADHGVGRLAQVPLRHQVRVHVVVGDRAVLIRAGDAVDPEVPRPCRGGRANAKGAPSPPGSRPRRSLEMGVGDRILVAGDRVGTRPR